MILITRNKEKSLILDQELQNKGFKTIIWPLFKVIYRKISIFHTTLLKFYNIQAIIISSSNAINYLEKLKFNKNIQIFAISNKTASNLQERGYHNIKTAQNSAKSLLELTKNNSNKKGLLLYLCGEVITENLDLELGNKGFNTKKIIAYKIQEQKYLSNEVITKIQHGEITDVTIYSKNTATIFYKLLLKHNLLEYCSKIKLLCFSDEIANHCKKIGFANSKKRLIS